MASSPTPSRPSLCLADVQPVAAVTLKNKNGFEEQMPKETKQALLLEEGEGRVSVRLCDESLWRSFHEHQTEMVITKKGRRMYPKLEFDVLGLESRAEYAIHLVFERVDDFRYKFTNGNWSVAQQGDPRPPLRALKPFHMEVAIGETWMAGPVSFAHIKLSNTTASSDPHIALVQSMHKWMPRVVVLRVGPDMDAPQVVASVPVPLGEFIAVTAYQNTPLVSLKIQHNPYARGFKDGGHVARKRRLQQAEEEETDPLLDQIFDGKRLPLPLRVPKVELPQVVPPPLERKPSTELIGGRENSFAPFTTFPDFSQHQQQQWMNAFNFPSFPVSLSYNPYIYHPGMSITTSFPTSTEQKFETGSTGQASPSSPSTNATNTPAPSPTFDQTPKSSKSNARMSVVDFLCGNV